MYNNKIKRNIIFSSRDSNRSRISSIQANFNRECENEEIGFEAENNFHAVSITTHDTRYVIAKSSQVTSPSNWKIIGFFICLTLKKKKPQIYNKFDLKSKK